MDLKSTTPKRRRAAKSPESVPNLEERLNDLLASPEDIEELINLLAQDSDAMPGFFERPDSDQPIATFLSLLDTENASNRLDVLDRFVHERAEPCLRICATGMIISANANARLTLDANADQHVDDLDLWPVSGKRLSEEIDALLSQDQVMAHHIASRATTRKFAKPVPFVLVAIPRSVTGKEPEVLLLINDRIDHSSLHLQKFRRHGLSPSEVSATK